MKKTLFSNLLIPFIIATAISTLSITSFMEKVNLKIYDQMLRFKPTITENDKLLSVVVDDATIAKINQYPISRSILADGLMVLRELGTDYLLLDTELVDTSPRGIDTNYLNEVIPQQFEQSFDNIDSYQRDFINAILSGDLPEELIEEYIDEELAFYTMEEKAILMESVNKIAIDNDEYLAKALKFFGTAFSTCSLLHEVDETLTEELKTFVDQNVPIKNIKVIEDGVQNVIGYKPSILPVISNTLGAGFVNAEPDIDGTMRRVHLIKEKNGLYFPQLAFAFILHLAGNPEVEVYKNKYIIRDFELKGITEKKEDLVIPITKDKKMMINWVKKDFEHSFKLLSFYLLYQHDLTLDSLIKSLTVIEDITRKNRLLETNATEILKIYRDAEKLKNSHIINYSEETLAEYRQTRELFVSALGNLLGGSVLDSFIQKYDEALEEADISLEEKEFAIEQRDSISEVFENARTTYKTLVRNRELIRESTEGAIAVFGYSGSSTTDIGVNPFEEEYNNTGIYPTIINNFFDGNFLHLVPNWVSVVLALLLSLVMAILIRNREPQQALIAGAILFAISFAFFVLSFVLYGYFIMVMIPFLAVVLVFIQIIAGKMISTAKDKAYIKSAFGQYLSQDVIAEIIEDPSKLTLGGEEKEITAIFTDVRSFSTISEKLTPSQLVHLLNLYLTETSNIVLENKGTIDKYEGDAIIGFFGAPTPVPDHPAKACLAAIRMKEAEDRLNERFIKDKMTPFPLQTRIGLNTGPCIVGNMGTERKMDYTMMGNDVNIAARLEGVNKQYGTWILASDKTYEKTGDEFLARRLDRVRVVGINTPIRLYNVICVKSEATDQQLEMVDLFERALTLFEERQWDESQKLFKKHLEMNKEDETPIKYINRCLKFKKEPPQANWDGVFSLTSK